MHPEYIKIAKKNIEKSKFEKLSKDLKRKFMNRTSKWSKKSEKASTFLVISKRQNKATPKCYNMPPLPAVKIETKQMKQDKAEIKQMDCGKDVEPLQVSYTAGRE